MGLRCLRSDVVGEVFTIKWQSSLCSEAAFVQIIINRDGLQNEEKDDV